MMQESPPCVVGSDRVELSDLLSKRRELTGLVAGVRRENDVLRVQVERSAAALDACGDASDVSRALKKHGDIVRRLHKDMRNNKIHERSTERKLKKEEAVLDRMKQEVKRNKELIDRDSDLPHEDELYNKLARAANSITAKDNLIQDLWDEIHCLTASHAAALEKERLQQKEKKRETERLFAHTDELKHQIKMVDRELAAGLIYTQRAMRLAQGGNVENLAIASSQSAPEQGATAALTTQQKIKQFDTIRRVQLQEQIEKESKRKHEAEERKRRREGEMERLRKLEEERLSLEEMEREQMRREVEKIEKMEREKRSQVEKQQRRLAEGMQRAKEEQEKTLQEETERLAREDEERQKERYRKVVEKEALLKNQNRWYYEGANTDWQEDQRTAGELTSHFNNKVPPVSSTVPRDVIDRQLYDMEPSLWSECLPSCSITPKSSCSVESGKTFPDSKPAGRRSKRRPKCPAKKSASKNEAAAASDEPGSDYVFPEVGENLDMGAIPTTVTTEPAEGQ